MRVSSRILPAMLALAAGTLQNPFLEARAGESPDAAAPDVVAPNAAASDAGP